MNQFWWSTLVYWIGKSIYIFSRW